MTSAALVGLVVTLAVGGLFGVSTLLRITGAVRSAELAAFTVATRALAGFPDPCVPHVATVTTCTVDGVIATVTISRDGTVATATAGPER